MSDSLLATLEAGDMRTIGCANEVAAYLLQAPEHITQLIEALHGDSPGLRMRSADVLEKVSAERPELIQPYKAELLSLAESASQQEVQWHLCQIISRLELTTDEQITTLETLYRILESATSRIVTVMALQAAADIALTNEELSQPVTDRLEHFLKTGSPAVRARARKLLALF